MKYKVLLSSHFLLLLLLFFVLAGCAHSQHHHQALSVQVDTLRVEYNNVHIIRRGQRVLLVDAGLERDAQTIIERLKAQGVTPEQVDGVLITHGHPDHAGSANALSTTFTAPIIAGEGDREMLARGEIDHEHEELCPTSRMAKRRLGRDGGETFSPVTANAWVSQTGALGDVVQGWSGRIIAQSSHTPGSLVFVIQDVAFVGDLFRGAIVGKSAETHFYMCDLERNKKEIQDLMKIEPPIQTFFTGHFGPVTRERVQAYLDE